MPAPPEYMSAFLLRSVDYGDADRIVTLLTDRHGKISALARSARSSRRRFGGSLQPCIKLRVGVRFGRGGLARLTEATPEKTYPQILRDLQTLQAAASGLSFVREMMEEHAREPSIFDAVGQLMCALDEGRDTETTHAAFRARILSRLGYEPGLGECTQCGKRVPQGASAMFSPSRGGIRCTDCGGGPILLSSQSIRALSMAMNDDWLPKAVWPPATCKSVEQAIDGFISHQLAFTRVARASQ